MAIKADWMPVEMDTTRTCPSAATAGVMLACSTAGSGAALGDTGGAADLVANPSGYKPAGILLHDVVSIDETLYHRNFHKWVQKTGEPVTLLRKGWVVTDKISGTPTDGATAYWTTNGQFTPTKSTTGGLAATPAVGEFRGIKDEDGYCKVEVNLPFPTV